MSVLQRGPIPLSRFLEGFLQRSNLITTSLPLIIYLFILDPLQQKPNSGMLRSSLKIPCNKNQLKLRLFAPLSLKVTHKNDHVNDLIDCIALCRYHYKVGHKLKDGKYVWGEENFFTSAPYPGQNTLQRLIIFGDMGKVYTHTHTHKHTSPFQYLMMLNLNDQSILLQSDGGRYQLANQPCVC